MLVPFGNIDTLIADTAEEAGQLCSDIERALSEERQQALNSNSSLVASHQDPSTAASQQRKHQISWLSELKTIYEKNIEANSALQAVLRQEILIMESALQVLHADISEKIAFYEREKLINASSVDLVKEQGFAWPENLLHLAGYFAHKSKLKHRPLGNSYFGYYISSSAHTPESSTVFKSAKFCKPSVHPDALSVGSFYRKTQNLVFSLASSSWSNTERKELVTTVYKLAKQFLFERYQEVESDIDIINSIIGKYTDQQFYEEIASWPLKNWRQVVSAIEFTNFYALRKTFTLNVRSPSSYRAHFLNYAAQYVNKAKWTKEETASLKAATTHGSHFNWEEICLKIGNNRVPIQCVRKYFEGLVLEISKKPWTKKEDAILRRGVDLFSSNWVECSTLLPYRNSSQCRFRYEYILNQTINRGRWKVQDSIMLAQGVSIWGEQWCKVREIVPDRTDVQCRQHWQGLIYGKNKNLLSEEQQNVLIEKFESLDDRKLVWSEISKLLHNADESKCKLSWFVYKGKRKIQHDAEKLKKKKVVTPRIKASTSKKRKVVGASTN